ncbi:MAG TPA: 4Fe-4S binding protein [Candidatus Scybalocola faecigallinarum]|uniref:4Fe-4S binding protein n=1 Tax=Candidatus Scybalocola faecigallinarum TaxID=2840941 RepID=A0A9D1F4K1_9FIRM|nr:4Fe-4S binding protein [Candidatus Scybalocola faecigallinarum]
MIRRIIHIDEEKCNGCGLCANACHEGAIGMVDGKARLLRDDYCDGLGDCLPSCPAGAISFVEREAAAYDEKAVKAHMEARAAASVSSGTSETSGPESQLSQWPVQIKLAPVKAPYFEGAKLLVAADCTAFAYGNFHNDFIRGKITLVGCPKLDSVDYSEKLTEILRQNAIKSVTVVRMEVPCCGGLENAVKKALMASGKMIPWQVVTISIDGKILD